MLYNYLTLFFTCLNHLGNFHHLSSVSNKNRNFSFELRETQIRNSDLRGLTLVTKPENVRPENVSAKFRSIKSRTKDMESWRVYSRRKERTRANQI